MTERKKPEEKIAELRAKAAELEKRSSVLKRKAQLAEAQRRTKEAKTARIRRTRELTHIGGMCEMVGLMRFRFGPGETPDNDQDDLRANLLVGALLKLSEQLEQATPEERAERAAAGDKFRNTPVAFREYPGKETKESGKKKGLK